MAHSFQALIPASSPGAIRSNDLTVAIQRRRVGKRFADSNAHRRKPDPDAAFLLEFRL
jgi:hypothetical protein